MPPSSESAWTLAIGPGRRLVEIVPLLEALRGEAAGPSLWLLSDIAPLLDPRSDLQRLVLDAAQLPVEDVGLVRRALVGDLELVLVGGDPTGAVVRGLQGLAGVRWLAWPLDTESLNDLVREPGSSGLGRGLRDAPEPQDDLPQDPRSPWSLPPEFRSSSDDDDAFDDDTFEDEDDLYDDEELDAFDEDDLDVVDDYEEDLLEESLRAELAGRTGSTSSSSDSTGPNDPDGAAHVPGNLPPAPAFPDDPELAAIEKILGRPGPGRSDARRTTLAEALVEDDDSDEPGPRERRTEPDPFDTDEPGAFLAARDAIEASGNVSMSREEIDAFTSEPLREPETLDTARFGPDSFQDDTASRSQQSAPPNWYRDQIADLADQAQKLDLGLRMARDMADGEGESGAGLDQLEADVAGLIAFTRTLGFVAAPPAQGSQVIDLDTLVEEQLGGLASSDDSMPRIFYRGEPGLRVRADKGLLVLALDAVLNLAARCAGPEGVVHTSMEPGALIRIDFPAGPLAGQDPAGLLDPYAVHRLVPGIGPNALAAADRILTGQGGRLAIGDLEDDTLRFEIELPELASTDTDKAGRGSTNSGSPSSSEQSGTRSKASDPEKTSRSDASDSGVPGPFTAGS
tara:strand:+ start:14422 stop:16299 length:1878 start_codon:yes stop_codon:yes gene_type:complete